MKRIKAFFFPVLSVVLALVLQISLISATTGRVAYALDAKQSVCQGAGLTYSGGSGGCSSNSGPTVDSIVKTGLNIFSAIIGIIAVVMIMIGGLKYMTSQGDSSQISAAKNTIIYASVGIVIVVLAQTIVKFVIVRFTK